MQRNSHTPSRQAVGCVTLVGAGPGDPELLTLKAVRAMQAADVILYDDLVSAEVLDLARREAKRMLVGKRGQRVSCKQEDINDLMVKLARQGKHVVRLKSGCPMIFGRAGEEIERLDREGIAVSVVPGVTSASAMAAAVGVSLTNRDCAQSVRFITGHARSGELPSNFDWERPRRSRNDTRSLYGRPDCVGNGYQIDQGRTGRGNSTGRSVVGFARQRERVGRAPWVNSLNPDCQQKLPHRSYFALVPLLRLAISALAPKLMAVRVRLACQPDLKWGWLLQGMPLPRSSRRYSGNGPMPLHCSACPRHFNSFTKRATPFRASIRLINCQLWPLRYSMSRHRRLPASVSTALSGAIVTSR